MKRRFVFLSLILAFVLMITMFAKNIDVAPKSASAQVYDGQRIIVVGKGDVETDPDTIQVSFALKLKDASLSDGQAKMRDAIDSVTSKLKSFDEDASVYTNYSAYYPIFDAGTIVYQFDCGLVAKSGRVGDQSALVDTLVDAGASSIGSIGYVLSNREESYLQALVKAKENAEKKANAIYRNATLTAMKEEPTFNFYEANKGEKIKISARVNACYLVENAEEVDDGATTNKESSTQDKTAEEQAQKTGDDTEKSESQNELDTQAGSSIDGSAGVKEKTNSNSQDGSGSDAQNERPGVEPSKASMGEENNANAGAVKTETQNDNSTNPTGEKTNDIPDASVGDKTNSIENQGTNAQDTKSLGDGEKSGDAVSGTEAFNNDAEKEPVIQDTGSMQKVENVSNTTGAETTDDTSKESLMENVEKSSSNNPESKDSQNGENVGGQNKNDWNAEQLQNTDSEHSTNEESYSKANDLSNTQTEKDALNTQTETDKQMKGETGSAKSEDHNKKVNTARDHLSKNKAKSSRARNV